MKKTLTRTKRPKAITQSKLADLYEPDEVAWLEQSVGLIQQGREDELDFKNLAEFLESMAISQRREVKSRLISLLVHLLKWQYQPKGRSRSWEITIFNQRTELEDIFSSATLRNHALDVLPKAYAKAVKQTCLETDLPVSMFPETCPYSLEFLTGEELPKSDDADKVNV
jgi:uncharacterized protein DUF29